MAMSNRAKPQHPASRKHQQQPGVLREDSDDELGTHDLPWEWIYESGHGSGEDLRLPGPGRKRIDTGGNRIIGARMGTFECSVGDCLLLKAEGSNEAWVAIACEFIEDENGEMAANFMWFSTEKEIRNTDKKRQDFVSVSWTTGPVKP
jgi:origin recognition complex subunit 1